MENLRTHLEMCDAALQVSFNILRNTKPNTTTFADSLPVNCSKYQHLNHPVTARSRVVNHSKARNTEYAVISTHTHFSEYLHAILTEMYNHKPMLVIQKAVGQQTLKFAEIVKLKTYPSVAQEMIDRVFRSLENERSTMKLFDKIIAKTNANIPATTKTNALAHLEMRHLFIHRSGVVDTFFASKYGKRFSVKKGDKLPTQFKIADDAIKTTTKLCETTDQQLLANNFLKPIV